MAVVPALFLVAVLLLRRTLAALLLSGLCAGAAFGVFHGKQLLNSRLNADCVGQRVLLSGRVEGLPSLMRLEEGRWRQRFQFRVEDLSPASCAGPRRLLLTYYGDQLLKPGERWRFTARLKQPRGLANPVGFNGQAWLALYGIHATGSVSGSTRSVRLAAAGGLPAVHHRLRLGLRERIAALDLAPRVAALLRAISIGDKSGIDHSFWRLLQQFGLNHLAVVSGLHIGFMAGVGYLTGGLLARSGIGSDRMAPVLLALLLAGAYAALAGFALPARRALAMLAVAVLARLCGRRAIGPASLLFAAVVLLLLNPLEGLGSGFWLSFGAVSFLLWLSRCLPGKGAVRRGLFTHVAMSLGMLVPGALYFGGASLVAAPANLLMIPLLGFFVVPLALCAALASLLDASWDASLWHAAAWPLEQLLPLSAHLAERLRGSLFLQLDGQWLPLCLALSGLVVLVFPGPLTLRALALLLCLPLVLPARQPPPGAEQGLDVTVLDVGQGTAVLLQSGRRSLLYDTGGGDPAGANLARTLILPVLRSRGLRALDTLVISHADRDHSAGMRALLENIPVARLRVGGAMPAYHRGRNCRAGEAWRWPGGQAFQFLSPAHESLPGTNNGSCVLQVTVGEHRLLLPGDIETVRERELARYWRHGLRSDWLLVGHHGSRTSSSRTVLKWIRPTTAVISSGYANRFGHPHPEVLGRLQGDGLQLYATANSGALGFRFSPGEEPTAASWRQKFQRYWM
jgi:competence protein ComEC